MGMYYSQQRIMPNNLKKINKYNTIVWSMWYSNKLQKIFNFHALPLFSHLPNIKQNKNIYIFIQDPISIQQKWILRKLNTATNSTKS